MYKKEQFLLEKAYELVLEKRENYASRGIVFRTRRGKDVGCCIGVRHKQNFTLSKDLVERIKQIQNLKFYAEGSAGKNPYDEPGMVKAMEDYFSDAKLQRESWDDITEKEGKGSANLKGNIVFTFMQHKVNKVIDWYPYKEGTMLEAMAKPSKKNFPKGSPQKFEERLEWLTKHMKRAGFYDQLNRPYNKNKFSNILDLLEYSVYPDHEFPDKSTYFGKLMHAIEEERNQTIYNLMGEGGCCFAGAGHLIELKQQFPELEEYFLDVK
jgi:hypothetical protein